MLLSDVKNCFHHNSLIHFASDSKQCSFSCFWLFLSSRFSSTLMFKFKFLHYTLFHSTIISFLLYWAFLHGQYSAPSFKKKKKDKFALYLMVFITFRKPSCLYRFSDRSQISILSPSSRYL